MRTRKLAHVQFFCGTTLLLLGFGAATGGAQVAASNAAGDESSLRDSIQQMQRQIQQLQAITLEMKEEAAHYRAETLELKHELDLTRQKLEALSPSPASPGAQARQDSCSSAAPGCVPAPRAQSASPENQESCAAAGSGCAPQTGEKSVSERVAKLEEDQQLLNGKVEEQYQTKIESAAKHRVKISGILLMNVFSNKGNVDHLEVPGVALPITTPSLTGGSFGATFRQSELGLEVYGPTLAGARTRANFVADFFGEFPETVNGSASGSLRLRTGTARLDWARTSVVAGLDSLFFSPNYPTSFASVGIPALSYSGNLWSWMPQLRIEHRLLASDDSALIISGGILDPLTGESPPNEFLRVPGAGESSRQPAYAARLEWRRKILGQPLTLGVGSYYSRENWGFTRNVDGWAATNDWNIPFGSHLSLSGKFYAGRAIGGLGAGIGRSIVWNNALADPTTIISPLESFGGWSQFKFKVNAKLEFNFAAGQDSVAAGNVRGFDDTTGYVASNVNQNRSEFTNFIYRPRSNLLFSTEFRTLRTTAVNGTNSRANQLNLIMGVLF